MPPLVSEPYLITEPGSYTVYSGGTPLFRITSTSNEPNAIQILGEMNHGIVVQKFHQQTPNSIPVCTSNTVLHDQSQGLVHVLGERDYLRITGSDNPHDPYTVIRRTPQRKYEVTIMTPRFDTT